VEILVRLLRGPSVCGIEIQGRASQSKQFTHLQLTSGRLSEISSARRKVLRIMKEYLENVGLKTQEKKRELSSKIKALFVLF
jgi:hypothetical protein